MNPNTLIVFDWDDTLFPTNEIKSFDASMSKRPELIALSKAIYNVLMAYVHRYKAHNIVIVSASQRGWIKHSLSMVYSIGHFRRIYNLLFVANQIQMTHPSIKYLPFTNTKQISLWKHDVFCSLINDHWSHSIPSSSVNSFISIGDSMHEFKAAVSATQSCDYIQLFRHRIKLMKHPSIKDLILQMKLLQTLCGIFEVSSKTDKAHITIDYEYERNKLCIPI